MHSGINLKFTKNDNRRVRVICKSGCPWESYCGKIPHQQTWQLRKIVDKHTCSREYKVNLLSTKWLSGKLKTAIRKNPKLKINDIRERVQRKWNARISKSMTIRARNAAKSMVEGSFIEQYKRLYDYSHELLRSNPGSTIKVKVEGNRNDDENNENLARVLLIFQRMYICFKACKDSFFKCRPIIGLDGCFFEGIFWWANIGNNWNRSK
uniref:Transposase MuDR plant domain-containing protein n=1 Tax=Cajanus cajan TaxID=3821 RepID=A0A151RY84_CAJCA|nr:hypothetical protein KK1_030852 [Cajanus cajan]